MRRQPAAIDDLREHALGIGQHAPSLCADHGVVEDGGVGAGQIPGLKEGSPIDVARQLSQVVILEHASTQEGRLWSGQIEVDLGFVGARLRQLDQGRGFFVGVQLTHLVVVAAQVGDECGLALGTEQVGAHPHGARCIWDIDHRTTVIGGDLDSGVHARAGRAADQQGRLAQSEMVVTLHLARHVLHLFQAGGDQAGQANDVGASGFGLFEDVFAGHHHAHVHDFEVVALQDHGNDVLANVVHIALDGGDDDLAFGRGRLAGQQTFLFFCFDVGQQMGHGLLHHAGRLDHLGQKHLARAKQVADGVHARHQWALDDVQGTPALGPNALPAFLGVLGDEFGDAIDQRMAEALGHGDWVLWAAAPGQLGAVVLGCALDLLGHGQQSLSRREAGVVVWAQAGLAIEHHVFHALAQQGIELVVDADHACVDDAHVHACLNGVVQKDGVDGLAHGLVAAKAKGDVGHAPRYLGAGQVLLDPACGLDEVDGVVVVLFDAGGDGEDVGIEDDVLRRHAHHIDQEAIGALADLHLALVGVGLSLLVKGHDDAGCAVALDQPGLRQKARFALFEGDRVDDALALHATQPGFDHLPLGGVDHDGHARDLGFASNEVEKTHHGRTTVQHGFIHVDVDDLGAVFNLLAGNGERVFESPLQNHARKGPRTGHIGAFADVDKEGPRSDEHGLQAGQAHGADLGMGGHGYGGAHGRGGGYGVAGATRAGDVLRAHGPILSVRTDLRRPPQGKPGVGLWSTRGNTQGRSAACAAGARGFMPTTRRRSGP